MRPLSLALLFVLLPRALPAQGPGRPIIDVHLHAHTLADYGGGLAVCTSDQPIEFPPVDPRKPITLASTLTSCATPLQPAASDAAVRSETLALLERYNIRAVTTGRLEQISAWQAASPERIIPALFFNVARERAPDEYRRLYQAGRFQVFAEISPQYDGVLLDDLMFDPYFALAEELDIPVGVHLGEGPPGGPHTLGGSPYRARLGSPFQLEEVLVRHPRLRVYVMHYGSPLVDEMIAVLYSHPQVYVDIAQNNWGFPRAHFYSQLQRLINAGFAKRIMWGSDQMIWPQAIRVAIETIEEAPFLSEDQKRDIFYNNAARFLRLTDREIARDHGRPASRR